MEAIVEAFIPIALFVGLFGWLLAISPVGKAYAERLRHAGRGAEEARDREALEQALEAVRRDVAELAERVDFTERLLARAREAEPLAPPGPGGPPEPRGAGPRRDST
jgi:hypothetical protein